MSDQLRDVDLTDLDRSFGSSERPRVIIRTDKLKGIDLNELDSAFGGEVKPAAAQADVKSPSYLDTAANVAGGVVRGVRNVLDTGAHGLARATSAVADVVLPESLAAPIRASKNETIATDKALREQYLAAHPESTGLIPTASEVGQMGGEMLATAPLIPAKAMQAASAAGKAIPYVGGKLAGLVAQGGLGGGVYGAATSSKNEDSVLSNVGTGVITGALATPVVAGASALAGKVINKAANVWNNVRIDKLANDAGMSAPAVKNIVARLDDLGISPQEAQARLDRMGPQATLADIDPALTTEAGGLAAFGGKPTAILKGRFAERAAGADTRANDLIERQLGPKPNLESEKEAIQAEASKAVNADYLKAHASNQALDVSPIVNKIDEQLATAVGPKARELADVRSYLFDKSGNIKTDIKPLHEVREGIDAKLKNLSNNPETSQDRKTLAAVNDIRNSVDELLKTNPEMAAADQKFAQHMDVKSGLDIGNNAITKKTKFEDFEKDFNSASPEKQDAIRKGLRAAIGDYMDQAQRGELAGAQQLFGKKSVNRKILREAFGEQADIALDELSTEAALRHSEQRIAANSATAERQAVQSRPEYGGARHEGHALTPVMQGMAADVITGTPGGATAIGTAKSLGSAIRGVILKNRVAKTVEGSAELLSRSGQQARNAIDIMSAVSEIQNRLPTQVRRSSRLPVAAGAPVGYEITKRVKNILR